MRGLHVPPRRFRIQMKLLKWLGYQGLSMGKLLPYLKGNKQGKVVGITFDDGYKNNLTKALPILKHYGFSATCYIISQKIGGTNDWDSKKGIPEKPLMNEEEIHQWIAAGMEIGSHTQHHIRLTEHDKSISKTEITQSKIDLEHKFSTTIRHFCYPYGQYNESIKNITNEAGYLTSTTVERGRAQTAHDLLQLPRVPVMHHTLPHLFLLKILSGYEDRHG